jgi:hypothetical protein
MPALSPKIEALRRSVSYLKHISVLPDVGHDDMDDDGQEGVTRD